MLVPKPSLKPTRSHFSARITETDNRFTTLWLHRYDFIHSPHPDPDCKPQWQTESRYPLSDRKLLQGASLYGVRHGQKANYALLDIDIGSPYHPKRDPLAVQRICSVLESLGLLFFICVTSSDSGGLHIIFPFDKLVLSQQLGLAMTALLESAGFKVAPGVLEVFPNRKPYVADNVPTLFNAHRLPLQQGSYLLDEDFNPVSSSHLLFVHRWYAAKKKNDVTTKKLKRTIKQKVRYSYRKLSGKALKFLNDLTAEIEIGWTGKRQTNRLLGRIVMRTYIFGHVLNAAAPLAGRELVDEVERIARSLPGFDIFCGHRHDLRKRICEWARSILNSHYFPYNGDGKALEAKAEPTWNETQREKARERIHSALLDLCRHNALPDGKTARGDALESYNISRSTLYRHKDLWHPDQISAQMRELIEAEQKFAELCVEEEQPSAVGADCSPGATNLLKPLGGNEPYSKAFSGLGSEKIALERRPGRNKPHSETSGDLNELSSAGVEETEVVRSPAPKQLALNIQWALQLVRERQQAASQASRARYKAQKLKQAAAEHLAKLKAWAASGDPVLVNEATKQLERLTNSYEVMI